MRWWPASRIASAGLDDPPLALAYSIPDSDWLDVPPDQYDDTMAANVGVPFVASPWVAKRLIAAGQSGSIVTTSSMAGMNGSTVVEYGASKAAVINMTQSLRRRLGKHGIRVSAI